MSKRNPLVYLDVSIDGDPVERMVFELRHDGPGLLTMAIVDGMKFYNDLLMEAGPSGNVQSEVLMQNDQNTFTFKAGMGFPS